MGVIAIVGPNNTGKTTLLRDVHSRCGGTPRADTAVVGALSQFVEQSASEGEAWIRSKFPTDGARIHWPAEGSPVAFPATWPPKGQGRQLLSHYAPFDARLRALRPQQLHRVDDGAKPETLLGLLYEQSASKTSIETAFGEAFPGQQVVLSPGPLLKLRIASGAWAIAGATEYERLKEYGKLPTINDQGSGTQSFVATLVLIETHPHPVLLIDEPEVSLAPPQARRLGQEIARAGSERQVFVATHSSELLRGVLETNPDLLTVIRLTRSGHATRARKLDQTEVQELWDSPLLKFTNTLDGLFHDRVVITEDDVDSRFYSWVAAGRGGDVQYLSCAGKQNLHKVARPLRAVGVDVRVIADFDLIRDKKQLTTLIEAMGGDAAEVLVPWNDAYQALTGHPVRSHVDVRAELVRYLEELPDHKGTSRSKVLKLLESTKEFAQAKDLGCSLIADEARLKPVTDRLERLASLRIHLVPNGEMESFVRDCASKNRKSLDWLNKVLEKVGNNPLHGELLSARRFVASVLADG